MNTNMLFGMRAFDLCEMLENIAPNVRELQLFRDDIAEIRMDRKCPFIFFPLFQFCFTSPQLGGGVCFPLDFTISPFVPSPLFSTCHRFALRPWSAGLFDLAMLGVGRVPFVLRSGAVALVRSPWTSALGFHLASFSLCSHYPQRTECCDCQGFGGSSRWSCAFRDHAGPI